MFLSTALYRAPVSEIATQALYQGVLVVFVAMLLYICAIRCVGTQTVALLRAFVPILSALAGVPFLGQAFSDHLFGVGSGNCRRSAGRAKVSHYDRDRPVVQANVMPPMR